MNRRSSVRRGNSNTWCCPAGMLRATKANVPQCVTKAGQRQGLAEQYGYLDTSEHGFDLAIRWQILPSMHLVRTTPIQDAATTSRFCAQHPRRVLQYNPRCVTEKNIVLSEVSLPSPVPTAQAHAHIPPVAQGQRERQQAQTTAILWPPGSTASLNRDASVRWDDRDWSGSPRSSALPAPLQQELVPLSHGALGGKVTDLGLGSREDKLCDELRQGEVAMDVDERSFEPTVAPAFR